MGRFDNLVEQIITIDTNSIENWDESSNPISNIVEKQQIYIWIRLYLKEESSKIEIGDDISMVYKPSGEKLETKFICYGKSDHKTESKDHEDVVNYNHEDDKKVLCLMVDQDKINNGTDIPFIRTLFKTGIHYEYQLLKRDDLVFLNERTKDTLEYFDCDY